MACSDIGEAICQAACAESLPPQEHARCLIDFRFATDAEALQLARSLYDRTNTFLGVETREKIEGLRGEEVSLLPALPVGADRHHLAWLRESLEAFERFVQALGAGAPGTVRFTTHPKAFVFYRTAEPAYPSAYFVDDTIAYNLAGPLHSNPRDVQETLFHELFHLNDAQADGWSERALGGIFRTITARCHDHECFAAYAPHSTVVHDGTFYAFDHRTGDVREYAAELALRYFLEQRAALEAAPAFAPPFKCLTRLNRIAWDRLAEDFFGGFDHTPECAGEPTALETSGAARQDQAR